MSSTYLLLMVGVLSIIANFPCNAETRVKICEDESKVIRCGPQQYIQINRAKYGRFSGHCVLFNPWGRCSGRNVLQAVRNRCGLRSRSCELEASDRVLGRSGCHYGVYLQMDYECIDVPPPNGIRIMRLCDRYSGFYGCDKGEVIDIISAFYGRKSPAHCTDGDTSNTNCYVNVTDHVKFKAQGKSFSIATASNAFFGDPCPGISKYLEIRYKCKNPASLTTSTTSRPTTQRTTTLAPRKTTKSPFLTLRLCDRYSSFYGCQNGKVINIISAFYGRQSSAHCPTGDTSDTNCYVDVATHIRFKAQGKGFAMATASNAFFGDPCPGISKYLEIRYECKDKAELPSTAQTTTKLPMRTTATTPLVPPIPPDSCGVSQVAQSRIVGGKIAIRGAWPWQIALYRKDSFQCGGSLISPEWIITATHCVEKMETGDVLTDYHVILGDYDRSVAEQSEERRQLQKIILHPEYNKVHKYNNDIAMLKLDRPVVPTMFISPVCLPKQGQTAKVGAMCITSGWGMTTYPSNPSNLLQEGVMPIASKQECTQRLATSLGNAGLSISDQMLCAGYGDNSNATNKDIATCRGDSGGPFVCQERNGQWTLQGVTSWGSIRCSGNDRYSVYTRVSEFKNWIDAIIANNGLAPTPPQPPQPPQPPMP